jgi:putative NADPH-quinone reductase
MKVLVVHCHPVAESFCATMRDAALKGLARAGHETRVLDLYAENFDPRLTRQERLDYQDEKKNVANIAEHVALIGWAEALVFVFPTWWYDMPAMLKGWLDRVWVPGIAFHMPEGGKVIRPAMTHIRAIAGITSCGSPWWWMKIVGEPHRKIILRGLASLCARRCRKAWLALYEMDTSSELKRERYLMRIERRMSRFA